LQNKKGEELPTPKKSNKLEKRLIHYINNSDLFVKLEKFLIQSKNFDVDFLHFFINVMEFKKENNADKAKLAAGMIIDQYLTEEAQNYIEIDASVVNEVLGDYERSCKTRQKVSPSLFDKAISNVEMNLTRHVEDFQSLV